MKPHDVILESAKPAELLSACPKYKPTPLLKKSVQNNSIWIKDETDRMGLGAFKALGGVYAVGSIIAKTQDLPIKTDSFFLDEFKSCARKITFVCASAGNHGLAVAAGAEIFGAKARIHLSDTVPEDFALRLKHKNAEVVRSGANYEESIEAAIKDANDSGAIHLADGSWPGYIEPPRLVMEGYTIMAKELCEEFEHLNDWPTHVYLQAGVGGFAAAVAFEIRNSWREQPKIIFMGKTQSKMLHCVTHLLPKEDALLHKIWAHRDQIILVRPDRYVAASFSDENQSDTLDKLRKALNLKNS